MCVFVFSLMKTAMQYECAGLVQKVSWQDRAGCVEVVGRVPLPLTELYWRRYRLSLDDVLLVLRCYPAEVLYQLGMLYRLIPSQSSIKVSFHTTHTLCFTSKAIIVGKLETLFRGYDWFASTSALRLDGYHEPPLPQVYVPMKTFMTILSWIPDEMDMSREQTWVATYPYEGVDFVPLYMDHQMVCAARVVPAAVFEASRRATHSPVTRPFACRVAGARYCGLEECVWLVPGD